MRNEIWSYLGIEPTKDRSQIKRAYASQLKIYHPEEDPEGFQRLRSAYEAAIEYAKYAEDEPTPSDNYELGIEDHSYEEEENELPLLNPMEKLIVEFLQRTAATYDDIHTRVERESWRELLEDERYEGIDVRYALGFELLRLLAERPWAPGYIWRMLDEVFFWSNMQLELQEHYPASYVNHIMMHLTPYWDMDYSFVQNAPLPDQIDRYLSCKFFAKQALTYDDLENAEHFLMEAAELIPDDVELLRLLGEFWMRQANWNEAFKVYQRIYEMNAEDLDNLMRLSNILFKLGRVEEALVGYQSVLVHDDTHIHSLLRAAACLALMGREIEAIMLYTQVIRLEPWNMIALTQLRKLNRQLQSHIESYISGNPDENLLTDIIQLADHYYELKEYDYYINTLKYLEQINELSSVQCYRLAQLLYEGGKFEEAETYFLQINNSSDNGENYEFRLELLYISAVRLFNESNYEAVISKCEEILSLNPGHLNAIYYTAQSWLELEQFNTALPYFKTALEQSDNRLYHLGAAFCLARVNRDQEALEHYSHAELDEYFDPFVHNRYVASLLSVGRYQEVLDNGRKILECDNYSILTYYNMAYAHYFLKDYTSSIDYMNRFISYDLDPEAVVFYAYYLLGNSSMYLKKWDDAVSHYVKSESYMYLMDESQHQIYIKKYAAACLANREFKKAQSYLKKLHDMNAQCEWTQLQLIRIYAELNEWKTFNSALSSYFKDESREEYNPYSFFYSGLLMMESMQYKDAVKLFSSAYNLGLRGDISSYLGLALFHTGEYHSGMDLTREALEERPGHPDYLDRLRAMEEHFEKRNRLFAKMGFMSFKYNKKPIKDWDFPDILDDKQLKIEFPGVVILNEYENK